MNNRNITIDIAKGLGIILVVLGHNWIAQENIELFKVIFSFHMPLFFFLAGVFVSRDNDAFSFLINRADALLKPYFSVLIMLGLFKIISSILVRKEINFDVSEYFYGVIYATGSTIDWIALWFLPHLFVASIVSLIVIKIISGESMHGGLILCFSIILLCFGVYSIHIFWHPVDSLDKNFIGVSGQPGLPWSIDLIPITSAYLIFGYLLRWKVKEFKFNRYGFISSVGVFSLLHYFFNEKIDLNLRVYGNPVVSTIQAFSGIYITLSFASLIGVYEFISKKIAYIGVGSIYILIFHILVQLKAFNAMLKISSNLFINGLVSLAFGVLLPLVFLEISKRSRLISYFLLPLKNNMSTEKYQDKSNDSST